MIGFDVKIAGDALLIEGLEGFNNISAIALVTFGFLFDCSDIWGPLDDTIITTWTDIEGSGGIYGDC